MSESRKNHLIIDGGQGKPDEHIETYRPILETDSEVKKSKSSLSKSKERVSADGAEEKLLKEDEAKMAPRVDMDAKFVVETYSNGDAKVELDANKRQFTGLTKEELLKYADDPFWVRLRWFLFLLFWALWLAMLVGAIVIIVQAPKCRSPAACYSSIQRGPNVEMSAASFEELEAQLPLFKEAQVQGVFTGLCKNIYESLPGCLEQLSKFAKEANEFSIKVITDLSANWVPKGHEWFVSSTQRMGQYADYFVWADPSGFEGGQPQPPNWTLVEDSRAWSWNEVRKQFYVHRLGEDRPELNFTNENVVKEVDGILKKVMEAGADGVRLVGGRLLLANGSLERLADVDQPELDQLLAHWSYVVDHSGRAPGTNKTVFTLAEDGALGEEFFLATGRDLGALRPPSARALTVDDAGRAAADINQRLGRWPALQLVAPPGDSREEAERELALFALLLPAAPVLQLHQLTAADNQSLVSPSFTLVARLRDTESVSSGNHTVGVAGAGGSVLVCARWSEEEQVPAADGHVSLYNPGPEPASANLTALVPGHSALETLRLHYVAERHRSTPGFGASATFGSHNVTVPARSTLVFNFTLPAARAAPSPAA